MSGPGPAGGSADVKLTVNLNSEGTDTDAHQAGKPAQQRHQPLHRQVVFSLAQGGKVLIGCCIFSTQPRSAVTVPISSPSEIWANNPGKTGLSPSPLGANSPKPMLDRAAATPPTSFNFAGNSGVFPKLRLFS